MDNSNKTTNPKPNVPETAAKPEQEVPPMEVSIKKIVGILLDMGSTYMITPPYSTLLAEALSKSTESAMAELGDGLNVGVTSLLAKDFGWMLLCFFTQKTKLRVFLQETVACKVGNIIHEQVLDSEKHFVPNRRPTISDVPDLTSSLYKIDELHKYPVDGFHTIMWNCFQCTWDAIYSEHSGREALARVVEYLKDTPQEPRPLTFGNMKKLNSNSFSYESAFGPIHFGPTYGGGKLCREMEAPRVLVMPGNMFTSNRDEGEAEFPGFLNYCMLNSVFTRENKVHIVGTKGQCDCLRLVYKECVTGPDHDEYFYNDDLQPMSIIDLESERKELILNGTKNTEDLKLDDYAEFHYFDESTEDVEFELPYKEPQQTNESSECGEPNAKRPKTSNGIIKISQSSGLFLIHEDNVLKGVLDGEFMSLYRSGESNSCPPTKAVFRPPGFGITFLGGGCGRNTGFILWTGGTGVLVDPPPSTKTYLGTTGVRVNKVILTHCHSDHDGGITGMTFGDERISVYTTRTIYESYVRKQLAITGRDVRNYQDFVPVRVGEVIAIGGAEFIFDYSLHTVPCVGFQIRYRGRSISYSGDTKYDPEYFQEAVAKGVMSPKREAYLRMRGFDADLIVHDLGGGSFHTEARVLNDLPAQIKAKMLVVHCYDVPEFAEDPQTGARTPVTGLKKPEVGIEHTVAIPLGDYEEGYITGTRRLQLICATPFLRSMYAPDLYSIVAAAVEEKFPAGHVIIDGPAASTSAGKLYLISEGRALMYSTDSEPIILNPRDMFGAFEGINTRIVAKTPLKVLFFSAELFTRLPRVGYEVLRVLKYRPFIQSSLAKSIVFKDLTQNQISVLSSCVSEEVSLEKNQTLIRQGDTADRSLYIIRTGSVRVQLSHTNPPIEIARLGPGNCVGEMAVLQGTPRSADVIANDPIIALRISQEAINDAMGRYPYIRYALMDLVAHRAGRPSPAPRQTSRSAHMPPPSLKSLSSIKPPPLPPQQQQQQQQQNKDKDIANNNNNGGGIGNFAKPTMQIPSNGCTGKISLPCIISNNK